MPQPLESLDALIEELRQALVEEDWERIGALNASVKERVDPVMEQLEQGELTSSEVQSRLASLQGFCDQADARAREVKAEAQDALKSVNQNRSAAKAYQKVSPDSRR